MSNNVVNSQCFKISVECDSLKRQIVSGGICSEGMVQCLRNASKDIDAAIDALNRHATHAQKAVRVYFRNKSVASVQLFQRLPREDAVTSSISVDDAARDAVASLSGDEAYCQATVRERLGQLFGRGGMQGGPIVCQKGLSAQGGLSLGQWIWNLGLEIA